MEYSTVESGDFTVSGNVETADAMQAALAEPVAEETAEGTETADGADADKTKPPVAAKSDDKKAPKRNDVQTRIDAAIAKQRDAERERDELRTQLETARRQPAREPEPRQPVAQPAATTGDDAADPEPQIEQFASEADPYTAYVRALSRWEGRQEFRKADAARQEREQVSRQQFTIETQTAAAQKACVDRINAATKGDPAFYGKINPAVLNLKPMGRLGPGEQATGATAIADCILDSDVPEKILVYFSEHADDFQRLSTLHPIATVREMGRLESRLAAADGSAPKAPGISAATPPIKPVGGSPSVTDDSDEDTDDLSEAAIGRHIRRENAKDSRAKRR